MPKVSIIILNHNRLEDTRECLLSCQKINYPDFEVILVDNGSPNNQASILKQESYRQNLDRNYVALI